MGRKAKRKYLEQDPTDHGNNGVATAAAVVPDDPPSPEVKPVEKPSLFFSAAAWEKIRWMARHRDTEVGGFGFAANADDPLFITDFVLLKQESSGCSMDFDDDGIGEYDRAMLAAGYKPNQFHRVWIHTHPGPSATPSSVDEEHFTSHFGRCSWGVMFIMGRDGSTCSARLRSVITDTGGPPIFADREIGFSYESITNIGKDGGDISVVFPRSAWRTEADKMVRGKTYGYGSGSRGGLFGGHGHQNNRWNNDTQKQVIEILRHSTDADGKPLCVWGRPIHVRLGKNNLWMRRVEGGKIAKGGKFILDFYVDRFDWSRHQAFADLLCGRGGTLIKSFENNHSFKNPSEMIAEFTKSGVLVDQAPAPSVAVPDDRKTDPCLEDFSRDLELLHEEYNDIRSGLQVDWDTIEMLLDLTPEEVESAKTVLAGRGSQSLLEHLRAIEDELIEEFVGENDVDVVPGLTAEEVKLIDDFADSRYGACGGD